MKYSPFLLLPLILSAMPVQGGVQALAVLDGAHAVSNIFEHDGLLYEYWIQNGFLFINTYDFDGTHLDNSSIPVDPDEWSFWSRAGDKLDNDTFLIVNSNTLYKIENGSIKNWLDLEYATVVQNVIVIGDLIYCFSRYWKVNVINATSEEQWMIEIDKSDLPSSMMGQAATNGTHLVALINPSAASRGRTLADRIALFDMNGQLLEEYDSYDEITFAVSLFFYKGNLYAYQDQNLYLVTLEPLSRVFKLSLPLFGFLAALVLLRRRR